MSSNGWIGVDLDGTLAHYEGWNGGIIGPPIPRMVEKVKSLRRSGVPVRIFTARVTSVMGLLEECESEIDREYHRIASIRGEIETWCLEHLGERLPITNVKDFSCIEIWDDRSKQVIPNTGLFVGEKE